MPASTYLGNAVLDAVLRGVALTLPTKVYVSLHTAAPDLSGSNEVTLAAWPSYERQEASQGGAIATGFDAAAGKETQNALQLTFPQNDGASAVTITHFAIWDAATNGNCLLTGSLTVSKTIAVGDQITTFPDALTVSVT